MYKKLLIMIIKMNLGGRERIMLNMIAEMHKSEYEITILMLEESGGFLHSIPAKVNVKYLNRYQEMKEILNKPPLEIVNTLFQKGRWIKSLNLLLLYLMSKVIKDRSILFKYVLKDSPALTDKYDTAIAYAGPMDFISYFVVKKIEAKRKIQWIHFDVTKIGFNTRFASKIYKY